jgi:hypothetical protein
LKLQERESAFEVGFPDDDMVGTMSVDHEQYFVDESNDGRVTYGSPR